MADLNKIIEDLSKLTVVEAAELSKKLEEKWGVTAATAIAAPVAGETAAPAEEKADFFRLSTGRSYSPFGGSCLLCRQTGPAGFEGVHQGRLHGEPGEHAWRRWGGDRERTRWSTGASSTWTTTVGLWRS